MKRALPLLAVALFSSVATAQRPVEERATRIEVIAGANLATIATDADLDRRTALIAGLGLVKPLAPGWAFEPELAYSMKGAKSSGGGSTVTFKLNYLEVPILFRYEFGTTSSVRPFINFGGAPAFLLSCNGEASGAISTSGSCDDADIDTKSFDFGLVGGAGLAFRQMRHTFAIGARYTHGLMDAFEDGDSKNRVWAIVGTIDFAWGSR